MAEASSYDALPYGSKAITGMSPNRMATLGLLFGLRPAPVETCRVLDIGCAEGGNVLPIAVALPKARVVGVDLSERQIALGRERVRRLGLTNVELVCADLDDLRADLGEFDYVTAHGVYSWISPDLQEKLLRTCHDLLAPDGLACVSYNTFPGWHFRLVLREMARYRAAGAKDPKEMLEKAREILGLIRSVGASGDPNQAFLAREWEALEDNRDEYLFHELLEEHNNPCWFHEFAARAAAAGLTYVADAKLGSRSSSRVPPEIEEALEGVELDRIEREQYVDFLEKRSFRRSLLCRSDREPLAEPDPSALDLFHVSTFVRPLEPPVPLAAGAPATFVSWKGVRLTTNEPGIKAALVTLWDRSPRPVPFPELVGQVPGTRPGDDEEAQARLRGMLLQAHEAGFVDFFQHVPAFVPIAGGRPVASPLVRLQAELGDAEVTSLLHRNIRIEDEVTRFVLARLDGTRDLEALARETAEAVVARGLVTDREGSPITDPVRVRTIVDEVLGGILERAAREALLTA